MYLYDLRYALKPTVGAVLMRRFLLVQIMKMADLIGTIGAPLVGILLTHGVEAFSFECSVCKALHFIFHLI